jgi:TolB-like protein/Tfp pilus assembly protein PilF
LPNLSFRLLLALIRAAPNVLGNDLLMAQVWPGLVVSPETVNKRVNLLRDALGDDPQVPRYIAGVRGRGYRLVAAVVPASGEPPARAASFSPARVESPTPRWRQLGWMVVTVAATGLILGGLRWAGRSATVVSGHEFEAPRAGATTTIGARSRTVAVLPFESISPDSSDAYLAQGLPEMILNRLSQLSGISVISRTSSFALVAKTIDSREIGRRLNAGFLISGTVQHAADRLRVTAQLVDTAAGTLVWSAHFDRALHDIFSVEDEVASQVADALSARLGGLDPQPAPRERSANLEAYLAFLRGRALLGRITIAESEAAVPYFEKAIALDPGFAAGYASLYDAHMQAASGRHDELAPLRLRFQPLIDRALAIDPQSGAAYFARAMWADDDHVEAREADFRRGLLLDPSNGRGLTAYAEFLFNEVGQPEDGFRMLKRALWIDPMSAQAHYFDAVKSSVGSGPGVIEQKMLEVLELDPNFVPALERYGKFRWFFDGKLADAIQIIERAIALDPLNPRLRNLAMAIYLDLGDDAAAREVAAGTAASEAASAVLMSLYAGNWRGAGLAASTPACQAFGAYESWEVGEAMRDYALHTGELDKGIALIMSNYGLSGDPAEEMGLANFRQAVYVSELMAAQGHTRQAVAMRRAAAAWNDANEAHYGAVFARRVRAAILLLDGRQDAALAELAEAFRRFDYPHWWYTIRFDPLWLPLHDDPQFRAIAADARRYVDGQRSDLEARRQRGEVPRRGGSATRH